MSGVVISIAVVVAIIVVLAALVGRRGGSRVRHRRTHETSTLTDWQVLERQSENIRNQSSGLGGL